LKVARLNGLNGGMMRINDCLRPGWSRMRPLLSEPQCEGEEKGRILNINYLVGNRGWHVLMR